METKQIIDILNNLIGHLGDDINILILEDDGMGYGARNGYCSDIYVNENKDGKKEVQI